MDEIMNYLPIFKKIVFLMVILFLILCMPINEIRAFADKFDTLQNRLEWYKSNHPIPHDGVNDKGECNEIVGYLGYLTWTAGEGQQIYGCEPGQTCNIRGTIGETTDKTTYLEDITYSSPDSDPPDDYVFSVFGFLRCTEPVLRIEPDKEAMVVNEMIAIKVYLDCGDDMCAGEPVILEIISGPGGLDLPELTSDELNRLRDLGYSANAENIIMTNLMIAEAMLYATDVGTIEIKATYESCRAEAYKSTITETAIVRVGQWVHIDCTYKTDPDYLGTDDFQWGGDIHCEVCLETYQDVQFGINVQALRGYASGTQECWVVAPDDYWIENKNCPAFTGEVIDGWIWGNTYDFVLDIDDSAALTYDICNDRQGYSSCGPRHEWDPVVFMETPIHLDADEDATYTYEGKNMLNTRFTVVARWK